MNNNIILTLYNQPETIFTSSEVAQLFPDITPGSLRDRLYYFTKTNKLKRLRQGIYAKAEYEPLELANKAYRPSYISLETVLSKAGIIFQHYERIFAVSYVTRYITIGKTEIQYRKIRKDILINTTGLEKKTRYFIASFERAFLDAVFIYKNYHFDNLGIINWDKVNELKQIYHSKALNKRVREYHKLYQDEYGRH